MVGQLKNTLIGVFFIAAIGAFIWLVMFLRPSVGDEKQTLYVRFSNINKINVGTRVMFAGRPVGEVTSIEPIFHARETQPTDLLGRVYFYQLTLKVDSKIKVFNTDEIAIQTSGLMGEKSIAIVPKAPPTGVSPQQVTDKTPFYADSVDPIENTISKISDIGQKLEETIDLVKGWVDENSGHLSHAVSAFATSMDQIRSLTQAINDEQIVQQVKEGVSGFTASIGRINTNIDQMEKDGVFASIGPIAANMKNASFSINKISQNISAGNGTLGRMLTDDDLYLRMNAIMSKADTTMNDINHYGLLFHLNKGWQRVRTKRMTTLNALDTPTGFRDYFQQEIDQINTSMARISTLIDKAQTRPESERILQTPKFKQDFSELLQHVDEMSANLKLYNQQFSKALQD